MSKVRITVLVDEDLINPEHVLSIIVRIHGVEAEIVTNEKLETTEKTSDTLQGRS